MVTACSNCRYMLEDVLVENGMDIGIIGITGLVADPLGE